MMEYVEWVLEHLVFPFPATYLLTIYWLEGKGLEPAEINKQLTKSNFASAVVNDSGQKT